MFANAIAYTIDEDSAVISGTESVGGGTRKDVGSRASLIRHFEMTFTLFFLLRVSDHRPHRKCLDVRDDDIGDALDNNDGQTKSINLYLKHNPCTFARSRDRIK